MTVEIGDKVKGFRFDDAYIRYDSKMDKHVGEIGTVVEVFSKRVKVQFEFEGKVYWNYPLNQCVAETRYPNPPHVHAELIKEWADGAVICTRDGSVLDKPLWWPDATYYIKGTEPSAKDKAQAKLTKLQSELDELKKEIEAMK